MKVLSRKDICWSKRWIKLLIMCLWMIRFSKASLKISMWTCPTSPSCLKQGKKNVNSTRGGDGHGVIAITMGWWLHTRWFFRNYLIGYPYPLSRRVDRKCYPWKIPSGQNPNCMSACPSWFSDSIAYKTFIWNLHLVSRWIHFAKCNPPFW